MQVHEWCFNVAEKIVPPNLVALHMEPVQSITISLTEHMAEDSQRDNQPIRGHLEKGL